MIDYNSVYQKDYFQSRPQLDDINNRGHYYEYSKWLVKNFEFQTVLDVGCGYSSLLFGLNAHGKRVTGVDISQWLVDHMRGLHPEIEYIRDGLPGLYSLGLRKFDIVFCNQVLEHIHKADIPNALSRLLEVTDKWLMLSIAMGDMAKKDPTHITIKPREWWIEKLARLGELETELSYCKSEEEFIVKKGKVDDD